MMRDRRWQQRGVLLALGGFFLFTTVMTLKMAGSELLHSGSIAAAAPRDSSRWIELGLAAGADFVRRRPPAKERLHLKDLDAMARTSSMACSRTSSAVGASGTSRPLEVSM